MASRSSFPASYKKANGIITVKPHQLEWAPSPGQSSATPITIPIGLIRNLQATPAANPKVMIKVFVAQNPGQDPIASVFTFTSPTARLDCDSIKDGIQHAIAERNRPKTVADVLREGEEGLLRNTDLQMSLLKSDTVLSRMFRALVIEGKQLTREQFWRARVHLLRAHAIEKTQQRGPYNVLAAVKPKTQDGTTKVSLPADRIRDIFEQHPLIKRVYDENVPKLSEEEFWNRFFMSRLKKKLSGEKITDKDPVDDIMDKYLRPDYDQLNRKRPRQEEVPNFIDLEGNEEHISKKGGNMPDRTMRPNEDIPIMHTINSLSRRMVDAVTQEPESAAGGTDERYLEELRLADLEPDRADDLVSLNINNPEQLDLGSSEREEITPYSMDPLEALREVQDTMATEPVDLIAVGEDTDALSSAAHQITAEIKAHVQDKLQESIGDQLGFSDTIISQVDLTHSSSLEFLRQFWLTYLSPRKTSARKKELEGLAQSLKRSLERMEAVRISATKEADDTVGHKVMDVLANVRVSIRKALSLWEKGE